MKTHVRLKTLHVILLLAALALSSGCVLVPHAGVGLDVNYYGGKFHVNPNVDVGISGYRN